MLLTADADLQQSDSKFSNSRQKFFQYQLPGDLKTMFALPPPIHRSVETLWKHQYTSIGELQVCAVKKSRARAN